MIGNVGAVLLAGIFVAALAFGSPPPIILVLGIVFIVLVVGSILIAFSMRILVTTSGVTVSRLGKQTEFVRGRTRVRVRTMPTGPVRSSRMVTLEADNGLKATFPIDYFPRRVREHMLRDIRTALEATD